MTDWIDSKSKIAQSTSKLPVIPPVPNAATETTVAATAIANPDAAVPMAVPLRIRKVRQPKATGTSSVPTLPLAHPQSGEEAWPFTGAIPEDQPESSPFELSKFSYVYGMPSWLVSFILHLFLLLLLAVLSFGAGAGSQILQLEMADPDSVNELRMFEVVLDVEQETLDEQSTDLEAFEEENLAPDSAIDLTKALFADLESGLKDTSGSNDDSANTVANLARGDGKSVKFFGAGAQGTKFIFVIDASGSMDSEYRWVAAKRELKDAIESLTTKQDYYVFLYNSHAYGMTTKEPKLVPATKLNRKKTFNWLDSQYPNGDTRPWEAMEYALSMKADAIFLLSDGELKDNTIENLRRFNLDKPEDEYNPARYKTPIHTIFLGRGFGEQMMKIIAEQNNGSFTKVRK